MSVDPNEVLFGAGTPSFSFESPGDNVQGHIAKLAASQQTDFKTKEPLFWKNGDPMMQVIVTLSTDLRDPSVDNDDGSRRVFIRGKSLTDGTRDAVRKVGGKKLEIGGWMSVTYAADGPKERGGYPPKLYEVEYRKPDGSAAANAAIGLSDPWAAQEARQDPALGVPNVAAPAPAQPAAPAPPADALAGIDLSSLPPAAQELLKLQLQQQQAGAQQ